MIPMTQEIPVVNQTAELADCRDKWTFDAQYGCWCLEDVLYTQKADVPKFQRLSIFVPEAYLNADGTPNPQGRCGRYTGATVPVVFENNSAGYMQMPHTWLGGPRCYAEQYLRHGLIYVTCGCRGRESRDAQGRPAGKAPITLVDLKTAIRFLRHNRAALPGDWSRIISVGWSAGGAMSSLLGVTGDHPAYDRYLEAAGAFMDESDAVFAAQIYCPIIDLEHADLAYEWMFHADKTCEDSPAGPAETMTPFKEALSAELSARYADYVNALGLRHPRTGEPLTLYTGGRSGPFYDYLMDCLGDAATDYLSRLERGLLQAEYSVKDYLCGRYTYEAPAPKKDAPKALHHAGPGIGLAPDAPARRPGFGELMSRPPRGVPFREMKPEMERRQGADKRDWLIWDGKRATITDLDTYVLRHRRRMKPCTSFDKLTCDSGENEEFGTAQADFAHFNPVIGEAIGALRSAFPQEAARYEAAFDVGGDCELAQRIALLNPLNFICAHAENPQAQHYRIRVGASDADTSLSVSMTLAVKLQNAGHPVNYALVWDQPHSEADYPGEVLEWIDSICAGA
ncbi:MAG: hypothetical protein MSL26_10680 [Clostridiales bacterium]|nr:hypothetical protein [Clostridiales bacterium]